MKRAEVADAESTLCEITIAPDGRVYVFGASAEVLEVLGELNSRDLALCDRIAQARLANAIASAKAARRTRETTAGTRS